ncbi:DUF29 domain-containing protein [Methylobacterium trifolii]|uniref:DUF29 domain-containing protein n=1 Tax=Methylobacterium trifolii TaxID=1003092 RepID=A0ABQ4TZ55_9HYPH|nr:DUF29 domain-containing protein [Methylobacterium trifolii]GJE60496.1 hypothetical protein MPOCJGCO_2608 [Methylobacterium trifolii]
MPKLARMPPPADNLYGTDFYGWARSQARALSARDRAALDVGNLIDEVESLGRSQRHAIRSHLEVLIAHLLKFRVQPERASPSWRRTLRNQRREIAQRIARNPSLRAYPAEVLAETYRDAVRLACDETQLDAARFPQDCPFTLAQILDAGFEPE